MDARLEKPTLDGGEQVIGQHTEKDVRLSAALQVMKDWTLHQRTLDRSKRILDARQQDVGAPDVVRGEIRPVRFQEIAAIELARHRLLVRVGLLPPLAEQAIYAMSYAPVLAAALAGIWARRRVLRDDLVLWCIVFTFVAVHVVYFPATRYRVPMEFVLLFYAAVGIDALVSGGRSRRGGARVEPAMT